MKILLLDEDTRDVPAVADVWRLKGHDVIQVTEWEGIDDVLSKNSFDAVLLDLMIPAVDLPVGECGGGFTTGEYLYRTKINPRIPNTPFAVFSSALFELDVIKEAIARLNRYPSFKGCFEKGCDDEILLNALSTK